MHKIETHNANIIDTSLFDSTGGTYWVGQVVLNPSFKPVTGKYSTYFKRALKARCPAALLVDQCNDPATPALIKMLFAEVLRCEGSVYNVASTFGATAGYLYQLKKGIRKVEHISDDFAQTVADSLSLPRLVVLYIAGRLTDSMFEELDDIGRQASNHIADIAARAMAMSDQVIAAAIARVEAEEKLVGAARKLDSQNAKPLLADAQFWDGVQAMVERGYGERCEDLLRLQSHLKRLVGSVETGVAA